MKLDKNILQTKTSIHLISIISKLLSLCKKNGIKSKVLNVAKEAETQHKISISKVLFTKGLSYSVACKKLMEDRYENYE